MKDGFGQALTLSTNPLSHPNPNSGRNPSNPNPNPNPNSNRNRNRNRNRDPNPNWLGQMIRLSIERKNGGGPGGELSFDVEYLPQPQ